MIKIEGLDALQKKLKGLSKELEKIDGKQIPFSELFNDGFMIKYTDFESIEAMLKASGYTVETMDDFQNIPSDLWDDFVDQSTQFDDWEDMKKTAGNLWLSNKVSW